MSINELVKQIQDNTEWLETSEGDLVQCIGIENLEKILEQYIEVPLNISQG